MMATIRGNGPAHNPAHIKDYCQKYKASHDAYAGDICYPDMVKTGNFQSLEQVGIYWEIMPGVGRTDEFALEIPKKSYLRIPLRIRFAFTSRP